MHYDSVALFPCDKVASLALFYLVLRYDKSASCKSSVAFISSLALETDSCLGSSTPSSVSLTPSATTKVGGMKAAARAKQINSCQR